MLIDYNNKDILNLQEQVLKNTNDINDIAVGQLTLANFGIHVSGILSDSTKLPDVSSYTDNDVGTAYLVGTETPYRLYILTKIASTGLLEWLDIGNFPQPGPKGDKGDKGDTGETGQASLWYLGSTVPTADPKYTERDCYLNLTNGNVYYYTSGSWSLYGSLRGPRGSIGATGPQGPQGEQGPIGLTGPKGDTGGLVNILGVVATAEELPSVSTVNDTDAYLVGSTDPYDIYVVIHQPNKQWFNIGTTGSTFSIVNLSVPEGTTSGTLSQGDYNTLQESAQNMIYLNGKYYRLNLDKSTSGYQVYSHTGKNPDNTVYIDEFTITISTKAWVITTINVVDSETLNTKLVGYQKKNSITDIDFPHDEAAVTYDTTNGMGITANVQITNQDGSLYTANGDVHVPIFPGDNITINAKADGTGVVINGPAAVSKEYVDAELAKKAPLVSSTASTYVTDINGNTTSIPYTPDATAATFCTRDANGNVSVATPTANSHAATKEYVDTGLSNKSLVSASLTGSSTDEAKYLTIDGSEYKIAGGITTWKLLNDYTYVPPTINSSPVNNSDTTSPGYVIDLSTRPDGDTGDTPYKVYGKSSLMLGIIPATCSSHITTFPKFNHSILLGEIRRSDLNTYSNVTESIVAGAIMTSRNEAIVRTLNLGFLECSSCRNVINMGTNGSRSRSYSRTIISGDNIEVNYGGGGYSRQNSLLLGSNLSLESPGIHDSIIAGLNNYINKSIVASLMLGYNLKVNLVNSPDNIKGLTVLGKYNDTADITDSTRLIVGAGTSNTDRRDCFKTGYDGTDSYITVGSTKVTESQLIQLLALLNPSTT